MTVFRNLGRRAAGWFNRHVRQVPATVILQTVTGCNLQCRHCFLNDFGTAIPDGKKQVLDRDASFRLIDAAAPAIRHAAAVQFSTFEALLHKDLFGMMDRVLDINPGATFPLLTNGMLLTREILDRLAEYPVPELTFSLDGIDADTVERFKTGVDFKAVTAAIEMAGDSPFADKISTVFVAHRGNIGQLPAYLDLVKEKGVRTVYVNHLLSFTDAFKDKYLYGPGNAADARQSFEAAIKTARTNGQTVWLPAVSPRPLGCTQCLDLLIGPDGSVSPCDFLAYRTPFEMNGRTRQGERVVFGNVFETDALEIYRSRAFRSFRKAHGSGRLPAPCTCCIDGYGLLCSRRLANDYRK